jgi:dipeptidase E
MRLLLLSNSRNHGGGYLEHARDAIGEFLGPSPRRLAFVPYAAVTTSHDDYARQVRSALEPLGHSIESLHEGDPVEVLREANGVLVGGGNTFRLLERLHQTGMFKRLRQKVMIGAPYIGWSAGANLACPTIRTTNDMMVVEPPSFAGLHLVPFQINPHYTDHQLPNHAGETREARIQEYVALNPAVTVLGLREGSWLRVEEGGVELNGPHPMRVFRHREAPLEVPPGSVAGTFRRRESA